MEEKLEITFEEKIKLLWMLANKCAAEGDWQGSEFHPNASINATSELNKMQGHYKKEKDIEQDIDEMKDTLKKLVELNKKEY